MADPGADSPRGVSSTNRGPIADASDVVGGTELRLALAMRGGVSLAVWIGGACGEIDELRRGESEFWSSLCRACGYDRVVVDVLAGASAGGLNGVTFASALRHGFKMVELRGVWDTLASVSELRRTHGPWLSLFDGDDKFLEPFYQKLRQLVPGDDASEDAKGSSPYIDLQLTATMVEPLKIPARCLSGEELWRQQSGAIFHFRHESRGVAPRHDLGGDDAAIWRLAVAARATSSFPGAFEAALVRSTRPEHFGESASSKEGPLVDCRGVFSETRSAPGDIGRPAATDFVVADGGIVDNIPIGRTVDAIAAAPASGPTRRALVYLHPTGPPAPPAKTSAGTPMPGARTAASMMESDCHRSDQRRGIWSVLRGLWSAKVQTESIDGDLAQLEAHNRSIRVTKLLRRSSLEGALQQESNPGIDLDASLFAVVWAAYIDQRSALDAAAIRELLDDPLSVLGRDPFPAVGDQNRWRAPLFDWDDEARLALNDGVIRAYREQLADSAPAGVFSKMFMTDVSALARVIDLLLECVRAQTPCGPTAEAKVSLYRLRTLVAAIGEIRQLAWVVLTASARGYVSGWAAEALAAVDQLSMVPGEFADRIITDGEASDYLDRSCSALDRAVGASGSSVPSLLPFGTGDGMVDLRDRIAQALIHNVTKLLETAPPGEVSADHPAGLLHHILTSPPQQQVSDRLISLEIEGLREKLSGGIGGEEIRLFRISATAGTPLATAFGTLMAESKKLDSVRRDGWVGRKDFLRPDVKLTGNELGNFSAFLDRRWRDNDWMWGRLDAASDLVDLLLNMADDDDSEDVPAEVRALAGLNASAGIAEIRTELIRQRQRQIVAEVLMDPTELDSYSIGLETPTSNGVRSIQRNVRHIVMDASRVLRRALPSPLAVLLIPLGFIGQVVAAWLTRPRRHTSTDPFLTPSER